MKFASIFLLSVLFLFSCQQEKPTKQGETNPLGHSSPTLIDVAGTFEGDMPCATCDKEVVTLEFKLDKSVIASFARVGGEGGSTAGIGTWDLNGDQVNLDISTGNRSYRIKGKQLQLEQGGKTYFLTKQEN